jgi:hypothetical protein
MISRRRIVLACLAIIGVATSVIHFAVAGGHYREYWLYGVFMLVVAWLQLAWSLVAAARGARWAGPATERGIASRPLLWGGALLNAGVVAVYVVTRTAGDMVGPGRNAAEPLGLGDGLCTILEMLVVAGCCWLLASRADKQVRQSQLVTAAAATGSAAAVLLSVALVAGGPDMMGATASSAAMTKHMPATRLARSGMPVMKTSGIELATASPAGDIAMPDPNMQMPAGMRMASSTTCDAPPTAAQQKAAIRLVNASWKGATRFRHLAAAKAAGYRPITPAGLPVVHYLNVGYYLADAMRQKVLNPTQPQSLVYANTPRGAVLVAAMYITTPGGPTPQPGGCLTQWHVHTNLCLAKGVGVVGVVTAAHPSCPPGSRNRVTPPMMHIWFVPIPGGPTAIDAPDAQIVRAAEQVRAPHNGPA